MSSKPHCSDLHWVPGTEWGWHKGTALFPAPLDKHCPAPDTAQKWFAPNQSCHLCGLVQHRKALSGHTQMKWQREKGKEGRESPTGDTTVRELWLSNCVGRILKCGILVAAHHHTCNSKASMHFNAFENKREDTWATKSVISPLDTL